MPKCPVCKKEVNLDNVLRETKEVDAVTETLYYCPFCKAILAISRTK